MTTTLGQRQGHTTANMNEARSQTGLSIPKKSEGARPVVCNLSEAAMGHARPRQCPAGSQLKWNRPFCCAVRQVLATRA